MHEPFDAADTHGAHGIAELRIVAGDDEIAGPGQHQAAGDALAVNLCNCRLGEVAPAPRDLEIDLLLAGEAAMSIRFSEAAPISDRRKIYARFILAAGPQVMARGEVRAVAGENDHLDRVVLHRLIKGGVEIVGHLQVLRVARVGPVHHDPGNRRLRPLHEDGLERAHRVPLAFPTWHYCSLKLTITAGIKQEACVHRLLFAASARTQDVWHLAHAIW